ncbi:NADH-quinone oxidoreductase subunit F [Candidatus Fermentibacteria bacterium]|nr:MAG: NADH-quinone oxidoreductase subunit F [Candidatus Fermentibacteria bacterium]
MAENTHVCCGGKCECHDPRPEWLGYDENTLKTSEELTKLRRETVAKPVIFIGTGTCGLGAGAGKTLEKTKAWLEENSVDADLIEVGCVGFCAVEPIMDIQLPGRNRISFKTVTEDVTENLLESVIKNETAPEDLAMVQFRAENKTPWDNVLFMDEHPFFGPQTRWVLENCGIIDPSSMEEYIARGGYRAFTRAISSKTPEEVCSEIEESGLRGRGGGGFPTGRKWRFAMEAPADSKYVICNADEGDPGAFMDRAVIEGDPHRLIEGMAIAAYTIGARKAYIYIRAEYPLAVKRLEDALEDATKWGLLGDNIMDSGFDLEFIIKMGAGAFVCGEETALIHSVEGKRGMPSPKPPYPAVSGLFGKPTVINNVETFANVPSIVARGASWYNSLGTEGSKGTKVFALSGKIQNTGLIEVAMGTSLRDILFEAGGGVPNGRAFKAVQIGGPSGGCIPSQHVDIKIDYESLTKFGAMMGSGGLVVMDEDTCMVDVAKFFMDFIQRESCGKCIPCREGTRRMLEMLESITRGRRGESGREALERFKGIVNMEKLAEVIKGTSLCGLGQTAPNPVLSTLRWFRNEYEAHIFDRKCPAGVCTDLLEYSIDADKCKGCTLCSKKCPAEAIMGARKTPHYIIPDKCIGCGACEQVCPFDAVNVS